MRDKPLNLIKSFFSQKVTLIDMNPSTRITEPLHVVNATGFTGGRWRISDYGDMTVIQPITSAGVNIGFPKKVSESFEKVINRLIKK